MNIKQLVGATVQGILVQYFAVTLPLTIGIIWVLVALQGRAIQPPASSFLTWLFWRYTYLVKP